MEPYLSNMAHILEHGEIKADRTGTGTISVFGMEERYSLKDGKVPVVTSKKVHLPSVIHELIWMLSGDTNVAYLAENGVRIWDEWVYPETADYRPLSRYEIIEALVKHPDGRPANELNAEDDLELAEMYRDLYLKEPERLVSGELGPIYQKSWRNIEDTRVAGINDLLPPKGFVEEDLVAIGHDARTGQPVKIYRRHIDQVTKLLDDLKKNPDSRRHILNAWHVPALDEMALVPCHAFVQFYVSNIPTKELWAKVMGPDGKASLCPSAGAVKEKCKKLGIPTKSLSCKLTIRSSDFFLGRPFNIAFYSIMTHAFANYLGMDAGEFILSGGDNHIYLNHIDQVKEQLSRTTFDPPTISFTKKGLHPLEMTYDDITIHDYQSHGVIKAPVAV